jgi:prolyl 4-hydroxylase
LLRWVSQVWIRPSFREDGQPSSPVSIAEQTLVGPLHEGMYCGHCLAGDDVHQAVMTFEQAKAWAVAQPQVQGFTFQHPHRQPQEAVRVWFKSRMEVLYDDNWWAYSLGRGI